MVQLFPACNRLRCALTSLITDSNFILHNVSKARVPLGSAAGYSLESMPRKTVQYLYWLVVGLQVAYKESLRLAKDQPLPADRLHDANYGLVRPCCAAC